MAERVGLVHESQLVDQVNSEHQNDWLVQDSGSMSEAHENFQSVLGVGMLYSLTDFPFEDVETTVPFTGMLSCDQIVSDQVFVSVADDSCICALPDNAVAEPVARTAEFSDILQSTTLDDTTELTRPAVTTDEKRPRKRKRNVSVWKQSKRKYCKNHGQAYTSSTGRSMPAKQLADVISCCTSKCFTQFTSEDCQGIFNGFWALGNHDAQTAFIGGCIQERQTTAHKQTAKGPSKNYVRTYHVRVGTRDVSVQGIFLESIRHKCRSRGSSPQGTEAKWRCSDERQARQILEIVLYFHAVQQQLLTVEHTEQFTDGQV